MLILHDHTYAQSSRLVANAAVRHVYSLRAAGDMRNPDVRNSFLEQRGFTPTQVVMGEQVHGSRIQVVTGRVHGTIPRTDGLVIPCVGGMSVGVIVADCVPILFADREKHIVAIAHAGWKGTIAHIASAIVETMKSLGSRVSDLCVSIGPHIGMCCYAVEADRAKLFLEEFGHDPRIASKIGERWHLDIGYANRKELIELGLTPGHIDSPPTCTSCQNDIFYSYRKDTKEEFGEILAVIGVQ